MTDPEQDLLAGYPAFADKGPVLDGYRLTVMTSTPTCESGAVVRVLHVCESVTPAADLYVMGPKPVWDEYVDDGLATPALPEGEQPLAPGSYDGRVLPGPGVDAHYEVTEHRFDTPGQHRVQWRPGQYASNVLLIEVLEPGRRP